MKLALGVVLLLSLMVIAFFIYQSIREKHVLARTVSNILVLGFIIVLFNLITLFAPNEIICSFGYSIYFIASDWMLYFLLKFSLEYIGNHFEQHVKRKAMICLLTADSIFILFNIFVGYLYTLKQVILFENEIYYELEVTPFFYVHYGIVLMLVTFCLISLFYKSFTAPLFYRAKYLSIGIITAIIVGLNIFTLTSAVDISIIGYVVEAISIYYCAFVYTPQKLLPKTLFKVAQEMNVALFVMDIEGNILYKNTYAAKLLDSESPVTGYDGLTLEEWCRKEYMYQTEDFTKEQYFFREKEEFIFKIQLQRIVDSHKQLQGGYFVLQDRTEELQNVKKERWLATHDSLTELYNKEFFYEKTESYIKRHPHKELLILCTDIKNFKMINDSLGTTTGDAVLIRFTDYLKDTFKKSIAIGRLGNDIFAVLIAKTDFEQSIISQNEQPDFYFGMNNNNSLPIRSYIGVYNIDNRDISVSIMCDRARMAIATIKNDYHKRIAYYDDTLRDNIIREQEFVTDLPDAIAQEQFIMLLQPQMSAKGELLGAEALIRWMHPQKGSILPNEFIPVFEKNGLITDVDQYIWEAACKQLRKWKDAGREDLYISVNISPRDFYFLNIYKIFTNLVQKYDINPANLKLEITETAIVMDFNRQMNLISKLRKDGFVVEMDDFGNGYSSLNLLKDLHVDILKIDMAFLKKANDEERSKKILQMIIGLSCRLDMPVITEGVETAEQVEFLSKMGCNMFQGYYFGRPMSVEEFERTYLNK